MPTPHIWEHLGDPIPFVRVNEQIERGQGLNERNASSEELSILYRDEYLVAINKPAGLLMHRSSIARDVHVFAIQAVRDQLDVPVFPVHRLDRPTSGVLLFALDPDTQRVVNARFASHQVEKTYHAVVRGHPAESGSLDYPLSGRDDDRKKEAQTSWKRLRTTEVNAPVGRYPTARYSLLELRPSTGRWHQLRRHCAHLRHPIIGDTSHGDGRHNRFFRDTLLITGLCLHASSLRMAHPITEAPLHIHAPWPERLIAASEVLKWQLPPDAR